MGSLLVMINTCMGLLVVTCSTCVMATCYKEKILQLVMSETRVSSSLVSNMNSVPEVVEASQVCEKDNELANEVLVEAITDEMLVKIMREALKLYPTMFLLKM